MEQERNTYQNSHDDMEYKIDDMHRFNPVHVELEFKSTKDWQDSHKEVLVGNKGEISWRIINKYASFSRMNTFIYLSKNGERLFSQNTNQSIGEEIEGQMTVYFPTTGKKRFELFAGIAGYCASKTLEIEVVDSAIIHHFSADAYALRRNKGEISKLRWNIENAESAVLFDGEAETPIQLKGTLNVAPQDTTTYRVTALSKDGVRTKTEEVTIYVCDAGEAVFYADQYKVMPNTPVTLHWQVDNAEWVFLNDKNVPLVGEEIFTIQKKSIFTLKVKDDLGVYAKQVEIDVLSE